jgi:hypothetical protein
MSKDARVVIARSKATKQSRNKHLESVLRTSQ